VGGATVSIDGTLTASDYIKLGTSSDDTTSYPKESGRTSQRKPNYYEYTDNTNYVYVRSDGSWIGYTYLDRLNKTQQSVREGSKPWLKEEKSGSSLRSSNIKWSVFAMPGNLKERSAESMT